MTKADAVYLAQKRANELHRPFYAYVLGVVGSSQWSYGSSSWYEGMEPCEHVRCDPEECQGKSE